MANGLRRTSRTLWAGVAVVGLVVLTACTGGNGSGGNDSGGAVSQEEAGISDSAARAADEDSSAFSVGGDSAPGDVDLVIVDRALIRTATITLESDDIDKVLVGLDGIVTTQRGIVESEDTRTDDEGDVSSATVVLRVPVDRFETAVDAIGELGVLVREETSTEDVTTKVADVGARVESAKRSIDQLRLLFSEATQLGDIIRLELNCPSGRPTSSRSRRSSAASRGRRRCRRSTCR